MQPIVLLAEDSADDQWLLRRTLNRMRASITLTSVSDGDALLCYLKGEGEYGDRILYPMPTLLMLDLSLPKLNGLAVLRQMKTQAEWATIKVAVLTGTHDPLLLQEANELGAVAVLAKPVSAEQLGTLLEAAKI